MLDYLWTSGATASDYGQFEDRTGIAMDPRLAADGEFYKMNPFCPENWVPEPILPHSAPLQ